MTGGEEVDVVINVRPLQFRPFGVRSVYTHPAGPAPVVSSSLVSILSFLTRSVHAYTYDLIPTLYLYSLDLRCIDNHKVTRGGEVWRVGADGWGYRGASSIIFSVSFRPSFTLRSRAFLLPSSLHPTCYLFLYYSITHTALIALSTSKNHETRTTPLTLHIYPDPIQPTQHAPADLSSLPLAAIAKNVCLRKPSWTVRRRTCTLVSIPIASSCLSPFHPA